MSNVNEIWKHYCERYEVSNLGNVRSLEVRVFDSRSRLRVRKGKQLKFGYTCGYPVINLHGRVTYVHRMVCEAFLPNPNGYKYVNHMNGDRADNRVENLEWCTQSHNLKHSYRSLGRTPAMKGRLGKDFPGRKRMVIQLSYDGFLLNVYDNMHEAERKTGATFQNIRHCLMGNRRTAGGFKWA
jgi:HNH endonuclease/NUMOD4 motif-containing protein